MNGRNGRKGATGRDPGGFVALPWSVLDSAAYARLSHPAKALLMEFARQFVRDNISTFVAADGQPLSCAIYVAIGVSRIECFTYRPPFGSYLSVEVYR